MLTNLKMARRGNRKAFTLIELVVVIFIVLILVALLIVAIIVVFGKSRESVTKTALETMGNAWKQVSAQGEWQVFLAPSTKASSFTEAFKEACPIHRANSYVTLTAEERSLLMGIMFAPTRENWDRARSNVGGARPDYAPPIAEEVSRGLRLPGKGGFDMLQDGYGNPIHYELDLRTVGAGGVPKLILRSGGPDGNLATKGDNLIWTPDAGVEDEVKE